MHSIYYQYSKVDYNEMFLKMDNTQTYDLRSDSLAKFSIPRVRTEFTKKFPLFKFPSVWNENDARIIENKLAFKNNMKCNLINTLADFSCDKLFCYVCSNFNN